jgi:zinc transport system permease protein
VLSGDINTAPGATIVIVAIATFLGITVVAGTWRVMRRRPRTVAAAPGAAAEPPDVVLHR